MNEKDRFHPNSPVSRNPKPSLRTHPPPAIRATEGTPFWCTGVLQTRAFSGTGIQGSARLRHLRVWGPGTEGMAASLCEGFRDVGSLFWVPYANGLSALTASRTPVIVKGMPHNSQSLFANICSIHSSIFDQDRTHGDGHEERVPQQEMRSKRPDAWQQCRPRTRRGQ